MINLIGFNYFEPLILKATVEKKMQIKKKNRISYFPENENAKFQILNLKSNLHKWLKR